MIGSYALLRLIRNEEGSVQHMLILNASVTDIAGTLIYFVYTLVTNVFATPTHFLSAFKVKTQVEIIIYVLFTFVYSMNFILITVDRFLYIVLGIKYELYCTTRKTKAFLACTWMLGVALTVCTSLTLQFTQSKQQRFEEFMTYLSLLLDFLFVVVASVSYGIMFSIFKKTRAHPVRPSSTPLNEESLRSQHSYFQVFRNSKFTVSALLVFNFFVLAVIPDVVYLAHELVMGETGLGNVVWILFLTSHISDAFIYMFTQPEVRKVLKENFLLCRFISLIRRGN